MNRLNEQRGLFDVANPLRPDRSNLPPDNRWGLMRLLKDLVLVN